MNGLRLLGIIWVLFCANSLADPLVIAQLKGTPDHILGGMLLDEIYKRANISLEFSTLPSKTALLESSRGSIDGETQRIFEIGETYPSLIRVPTSFTYFEATAFSKKHQPSIAGWFSLDGYNIGMVRGMKFAELGLDGMSNVYPVGGSDQLFKMLNSGRVDVVVSTQFNGLYQLKKLELDSIYPLRPVLERYPLYHYLHEKHKALIPKIDAVIKSMKESGELDVLRGKIYNELLNGKS